MSTRKYTPEDFGTNQMMIDRFRFIESNIESKFNWNLSLGFAAGGVGSWVLTGFPTVGIIVWITLTVTLCNDKKKAIALEGAGLNDFQINAIKQYERWRNFSYQPEASRVSETIGLVSEHRRVNVVSERDQLSEIRRNIDAIRNLHWRDFERYVGAVYQANGYIVRLGSGSNDGGVDAIARKDSETIAIQCKNHNRPLPPEAVRAFATAWGDSCASKGVIVASRGFYEGALQIARRYSIQCLDCYDILAMIRPDLNNQMLIMQLRAFDTSVRIANMTESQRYYARETARRNR